MAKKDSLKDNDVAQTAFTAASPFGWNKAANDILDNEAVAPSHQRIQEVAATLDKKGQAFQGKLGSMQPITTTRKVVRPAPTPSPETVD